MRNVRQQLSCCMSMTSGSCRLPSQPCGLWSWLCGDTWVRRGMQHTLQMNVSNSAEKHGSSISANTTSTVMSNCYLITQEIRLRLAGLFMLCAIDCAAEALSCCMSMTSGSCRLPSRPGGLWSWVCGDTWVRRGHATHTSNKCF